MGAAPTAPNRFQQAVVFEVEDELTELIEEYLVDHGAARIKPLKVLVGASIEENAPEPWLRAINVQVELPADSVDPAPVLRLLRAHFVSRGFSLQADVEKPVATIAVTLAASAAKPAFFSAYRLTQYLLLVSIGILMLIFFVWLFRSRRTPWVFPELAIWMTSVEEMTDARSIGPIDLSMASADRIRHYFQETPITEAIKILSQLDQNSRQNVLDVLKIHQVVRGRIEKRMRRIREDISLDRSK